MPTPIQELNLRMRKKRLESTNPTGAPDVDALRRRVADYAKKSDIESLEYRISELSQIIDEKVENLLNAVKETVRSVRDSLSENTQQTASELRKEYQGRLKKIEESSAFLENTLGKVKAYTDKLPKVINFPVQRSVSIPVATDEGGLGTTVRPTVGQVPVAQADGTYRPGSAPAGSGISRTVITKAIDYSIATTDDMILADASGASITLTLPSAITAGSGKVFTIKQINSGANTVTVATTGGQTIDGDSTQVLQQQYVSIDLVSDGANWSII